MDHNTMVTTIAAQTRAAYAALCEARANGGSRSELAYWRDRWFALDELCTMLEIDYTKGE